MADFEKLYSALSQSFNVVMEENKKLKQLVAFYEGLSRQWEKDKANQAAIIQQLVSQKNKEHQELAEENQKLQHQVYALKGS